MDGGELRSFTSLLLLIVIWPGIWGDQPKKINNFIGKDIIWPKEKGIIWAIRRFSRNEFWKFIGCIISDLCFVVEVHKTGSRKHCTIKSHLILMYGWKQWQLFSLIYKYYWYISFNNNIYFCEIIVYNILVLFKLS